MRHLALKGIPVPKPEANAENQIGQLGYIAAFSGKLGNSNHHEGFVPPVYDLLDPSGFFRKEEIKVNDLTLELHRLEQNQAYVKLKNEDEAFRNSFSKWIEVEKAQLKKYKKQRQEKRDAANQQDSLAYHRLIEDLKEESIRQQIQFKQQHYTKKQVLDQLGHLQGAAAGDGIDGLSTAVARHQDAVEVT